MIAKMIPLIIALRIKIVFLMFTIIDCYVLCLLIDYRETLNFAIGRHWYIALFCKYKANPDSVATPCFRFLAIVGCNLLFLSDSDFMHFRKESIPDLTLIVRSSSD